jgi:hypothetical protein
MPEVLFGWALFVVALCTLPPPTRAPSLTLAPDEHREAPTLIGLAVAPSPASPASRKLASSFRLPRSVDVSVSSLLKSLGAATYYRVAPGFALGAGGGVAALELPSGNLRALQLLTVLRWKF